MLEIGELASEQTIVIAAEGASKVREMVRRYDEALCVMDMRHRPQTYEASVALLDKVMAAEAPHRYVGSAAAIVWPRSLKRRLQEHRVYALQTADRMLKWFIAAGTGRRNGRKDHSEGWQKTRSGHVHTMQLKRGKRGRVVPARQLVTA